MNLLIKYRWHLYVTGLVTCALIQDWYLFGLLSIPAMVALLVKGDPK